MYFDLLLLKDFYLLFSFILYQLLTIKHFITNNFIINLLMICLFQNLYIYHYH